MPDASTIATCATCGGCRVEALVWCGVRADGGNRWEPVPCSACSVCPDPMGHERDNAGSETVIRLKREGRYVAAGPGLCDYCRGRRP